MADDHMTDSDHRKTNAKLYKALSEGDDTKVCQICRDLVDGPFHILTIHDDSVLHIACYYKRNDLALQLLSLLPEDQSNKLTLQNEDGNTILHATATNNNTIEAATEMLRRAPSLLTMTNDLGETPLFRAARYGKTNVFYYLKDKMGNSAEADLWKLLQRNDKATILHAAIQSENFELAHDIAKTFPILIGQQDGDGMTGLQHLSCKPSAFENEFKDDLVKRFIYKFIDRSSNKGNSRVPIVKEIQKQIVKSESVKKLATLLIESDDSWEATESMSNHNRTKLHKYGTTAHVDIITTNPIPDSPLFLATKSGCTEIVKEILKVYPQAVEHIDEDGRNIMHVAIKYRRMDIFNTVINMKNPLARLRGKIDKKGNSILHMAGNKKAIDQRAEVDIRSPALILRDELLLFERVKKICTKLATMQVNEDRWTAEQVFIENNEKLRIDAKEWMKSTAEHCTIVAVLIATVAFAAAYTVPGGPNQNTGYPLLKSKPLFMLFTVADALSLTFSLTSVIIFLSILTSSFRLKDFQTSLHNKLLLGLTVLILSVSMMMVAFAATLILTISSGRKWTNFILYIISFFPITVFVCSYVNLYKLLIKAFGERVKDIIACLKATWNLRNHSLPEGNVESHLISQHFGLGSQAPTTSTESSTKTLV